MDIILGVVLGAWAATMVVYAMYAVGKQHILHYRSTGLHEWESAVGAVAQLYPSSAIPSMCGYISTVSDNTDPDEEIDPVDCLIGNYVQERRRRMLLTVPNLFQHTGCFSSRSNGGKGYNQDCASTAEFE